MGLLCRVMEVSRSTYWAYRGGRTYQGTAKQQLFDERVKKMFGDHRRRLGSRRMVTELLKEHGIRVGRCAVRSSYRRQGLVAICPKPKRPWTTDSSHREPVSPNLLLEGNNEPFGSGEVFVGDITYLPLLGGGFAYLATVQDMFTKQLAGWSVSDTLEADFVVKALRKAIFKGMIRKNAIIHTDRGSQYVSNAYRNLLKQHGFRQSMSRKGNCYDNAQAESFFARFKIELLDGGKFDCLETAKTETFGYIEGYYNRRRPHSTLNNLTPDEFANDLPKAVLSTKSRFGSMSSNNPAQWAAI